MKYGNGKLGERIIETIRKQRTFFVCICAMVVFVTTYLLILPAITLDQDTAKDQGGIDIPTAEQVQDVDQAKDADKSSADVEDKEAAEDADKSASEDTDKAAAEDSAAGGLSYEGNGYTVEAAFGAKAGLPEDTSLEAVEIKSDDEDYDTWRDEALKAVQEAKGGEQVTDLKFAKFYDISLIADGQAIEPEAPVDISISYDKALKAADADHVRIIHFGTDENGDLVPEVLDPDDVDLDLEKGKMSGTAFAAESFSVYGVVYTVDFSWEVDGKEYEFSLPGGGFISLGELLESLKVVEDDSEAFITEVEKAEFSDPDLVWVGKAEDTTTVGELKEANELDCQYSEELTEEEIEEINAKKVEAGDWALISLKPFDTEETLTVTMKNGETFVIKVTDAKDAIVINENTREIQTIPNPSGTTITMFDYWLNSEGAYARQGWPGYTGDGIQNGNNNWTNRHGGDNAGINNGHRLKFVPGADNSATDYWVGNGANAGYTENGRVNGINSWNGTWNNAPVYTGEPTTGIVAGALYNGNNVDENGYPKLNNALGGESLGYLFDPGNNSASSYRKTYSGVDDFLYVDSQGYYTYDSQYYRVSKLDGTTNHFTVSEQPADNGQEGYLGFWPMDMRNYWFGMHLETPFSIPANGRVLNPKGEYQPMQFEFAGDDDAWVYIDGILIADGGGIHNRTELDINFQTGEVLVRGGTYTNITSPNTSVYSRSTIYQKFLDAKNRGEITQAEWDAKYTNTAEKTVWIDTNNDGTFDTFAPGTYHNFDFFYLERGGAESNCYLRYNLITTTDFSAHKSYHNEDNPATTNVDESRLRRNQFKFELRGFDNPDYAGDGAELVKAIMPDYITRDPSKEPGTFENPLFNTVSPSDTAGGYQSLIIGNTEDGNVNFGDKEISSAYAGKSYKYMVREVVPDNAVNADNVRWADASEELRAEGGFVLDGIMYDSRVYYFIGTVVETAPGSGKYKMTKERFLDPECTQPDPANFHSFVNGKETPASLKINKKSDTEAPLDGAVFSLTRAMQNADDKWVVKEWTINNVTSHSQPVTGTTSGGTLTFSNLTEGHYLLEELEAPVGYQMGEQHRWLLTLEKIDATDEIQLVPYITPLDADGNVVGNRVPLDPPDDENIIEYEVLNGPLPPIDLSLQKKWNDNGDTSVPDGAEATFELHRIKTVPPVTVKLLDKNGNKLSEVSAFAGDTIQIYDNGTNAFRHHTDQPSWQQVAWWNDNTRTASDTLTVNGNDIGWTISTTATFVTAPNSQTAVSSYTVTSNGRYTVNQSDATAGVIELKLSTSYIGSNRYYFEIPPTLYISQNAGGSTTADEVISTFTLKTQNGDGDAGNPWKKSFDDLPLVDENGHPYSYYFKEVNHSPANFNIPMVEGNMGTAESPLTESGNVVITNNAPELPKITASKIWKDENGDPIDAESGIDGLEVKLTLYKGTLEAPAAEVKNGEVTRTVTGNGTATWFLLDENADVSQYTVKETAVKIPGGDFITIGSSNNAFGGEVTGNSSIGFTVTNQLPTTEIEVTKQWKDGTSANADKVFNEAKTISFTLYQKLGNNEGTPYENEGQPVTGTVTYTPASGGTAASWSTETISNLPKYEYKDGSWYGATYYPVESEINGVTTAYQKDGGSASETPADAAVSSGTVTIINTDIVAPIKIVKIDKDTEAGLTGAKFQLTRKLPGENSFTKFEHSSFEEDADNENKKTGPFTVSSTDGIILEGLLPGEYRIEEKEVPAGYINSLQPFTFTVSSDGEVTISSDADSTLVWHLDKIGDNPEGLKIGNEPGTPLPSSGGPGTTWIYLIGSILLICCSTLLVARRRTRRES